MSDYLVTTLPSGRRQHRCVYCSCNVNPRTHVPDSEECRRANDERLASIRDD